jgi:hypothetical protein
VQQSVSRKEDKYQRKVDKADRKEEESRDKAVRKVMWILIESI